MIIILEVGIIRKWFEPRSNLPWLKMIIWVTGVLRRTVVAIDVSTTCTRKPSSESNNRSDLAKNVPDHHFVKTSHTIDWDSATRVTYSTDYYQRITLENCIATLQTITQQELVTLTHYCLLNSQPRIMHFAHSDWFTQSWLLAHIP